mgnify:CR=1 FL=1
MADDATVNITATILPDEIAKTISGTMTISPADANDKWYYKLTSVSNSSTNLMAGDFIDYTAVDDDTATTAIATGDKVNFLLVQNQSSTANVFIVVDGGTASSTAGDAFLVGASQTWYGRLPNATVDDIHAISSTGTVTCVVAALLDDVG